MAVHDDAGETPHLQAIRQMLAGGDRRHALWLLFELGTEARPLSAAVIALARDADPEVRGVALEVLEKMEAPEAIPVLVELLAHPDEHTRAGAARALQPHGPAAAPAITGLIELLGEEEQYVWEPAWHTLRAIGPAVIAPVRTALTEGRVRRSLLLYVLADAADDPAVVLPDLIRHLDDPDPTVQRGAAAVLGRLGPRAAPAIPALLRHVPVDEGGGGAAGALAKIGRPAAVALLEALRASELTLRRRAARALTEFGPELAWAAPLLIEALRGKDAYEDGEEEEAVAGSAVSLDLQRVLRRIGPVAVPDLVRALTDADPRQRRIAADVLGLIGAEQGGLPHAAVTALVARLADEEPNVRGSVAGALGGLDRLPASAAGGLAEALLDESDQTRWLAARALRRLGVEAIAAADVLATALDDPYEGVRLEAVAALAAIPALRDYAIRAIRPRRGDKSPRVRVRAAAALWAMTGAPTDALAVIATALAGEDNDAAVEAADLARALGPDAAPIVPALIAGWRHPVESIRRRCAFAIGAVGHAAAAAAPALADALTREDFGDQLAALLVIGKLGRHGSPAVPALEAMVMDSPSLSEAQRCSAAVALIRIEEDVDAASPVADRQAWLQGIGTPDSLVGGAIQYNGLDPATGEYLLRVLTDGSERVRKRAAAVTEGALWGLVPGGVLVSEDRAARVAAAENLRKQAGW